MKRLKNRVNKEKEETCQVSVNDLEANGALIISPFKQVHSEKRLTFTSWTCSSTMRAPCEWLVD